MKNQHKSILFITLIILFIIYYHISNVDFYQGLSQFHYIEHKDSIYGEVELYHNQRGWRMIQLQNGDSLLFTSQEKYEFNDGKMQKGDIIIKKINNDTLFIYREGATLFIEISEDANQVIQESKEFF